MLGFEVLHDNATDGHRYLHVGVPGQDEVGLWLLPSSEASAVGNQTGGEPLVVLYTDDLDRVVEHLGNVIVVAELR